MTNGFGSHLYSSQKELRDDIANHAVRSPESVLSNKLKAASTQGGKKPITLPTIGRK